MVGVAPDLHHVVTVGLLTEVAVDAAMRRVQVKEHELGLPAGR